MANIPSRVQDRIVACIKRFQPILTSAKARDVNESDTVIIVTDMLGELFGYDKYSEITSEHAIRGTYCDLAVSIETKLHFLVEVKAIGLELKDAYIKQAVDYAANKGADWVVLTNSTNWRIYKVTFTKPIDHELVAEIDFLAVDPKSEEDLGLMFMLTKEGWGKQVLSDYHEQKQALSRFCIGAVVLSEPVLSAIRKELRKISPEVKIQVEQIENVLLHEVIKREVVEGEKADEAKRKVARVANKASKAKAKEETAPAVDGAPISPQTVIPPPPQQPSQPPNASA